MIEAWRYLRIPLFSFVAIFALIMGAALLLKGDDAPGIAELREANAMLVDYQVDQPTELGLWRAAWKAAQQYAIEQGVEAREIDQPTVNTQPADLETAIRRLQKDHKLKAGDFYEAVIGGMVNSLDDAHTRYIRYPGRLPTYMPAFLFRVIRSDDGLLLWDVEEGSLADRAGLRVGDSITAVGNNPISRGIPAQRESTYKFSIKGTDGRVRKVALKAEGFSLKPFETRMLGNVAYFQLYAFPPLDWRTDNVFFEDNLEAAMSGLAEHAPEGWILDLRNNGGGAGDTIGWMAGAFGSRSVVAWFGTELRGAYPLYAGKRRFVENTPVAVLVNGGTASAAEVLAYNLQQTTGARVFGTQSAGAVRSRRDYKLKRGGSLAISVNRVFLNPGNVEIEKVGVTPDEVVTLTPERVLAGHDDVLERAIEWLKTAPAAQGR